MSWFVHHKKNEKAKGPQQYLVSLKDLAHLFSCRFTRLLLRKEVIQPHLPVRLPCYDFTPLTRRTLGTAPLSVRLATSGTSDSDGVTGGVYKARERIHRAMLMRDY